MSVCARGVQSVVHPFTRPPQPPQLPNPPDDLGFGEERRPHREQQNIHKLPIPSDASSDVRSSGNASGPRAHNAIFGREGALPCHPHTPHTIRPRGCCASVCTYLCERERVPHGQRRAKSGAQPNSTLHCTPLSALRRVRPLHTRRCWCLSSTRARYVRHAGWESPIPAARVSGDVARRGEACAHRRSSVRCFEYLGGWMGR